METESHIRPWAELIPDILGMIFIKLLLSERLTLIPMVCKKWNNVVKGPYCWKEIVIDNVLSSCLGPEQTERLIKTLIKRSCGSIQKLSVYELQSEEIFTFIAENVGGNIYNLSLPRCNIKDYSIKQITEKLSMITILDLNYCMDISINAIEIIGMNCKYLEVFHRKMHPSDTSKRPAENSEAYAIATTMPKLKHLEICYNDITNDGVKKILVSCVELEFLDLRGCWDVNLDEINVNEDFPNMQILGPEVVVYYNRADSSDYSDSEIEDIYECFLEDGIWSDEEGLFEFEYRAHEEEFIYQ